MKILRVGLRLWITVASVASFALGWVLLVHAPKPPQFSKNASAAPTLEPLEPLPPLFGSSENNFQQNQQPLFSVQPRMRPNTFFRTGGS